MRRADDPHEHSHVPKWNHYPELLQGERVPYKDPDTGVLYDRMVVDLSGLVASS